MLVSESANRILMGMKPCNTMRDMITKLANKAGLDLTKREGAMRIDHEPYQRLCIEKIDSNLISVAHYYEQNGDLCQDPDMVFIILENKWYPISFQNSMRYDESVKYDNNGTITAVYTNIRSMSSFSSTWARTIKEQGYLKHVKPIKKEEEAIA